MIGSTMMGTVLTDGGVVALVTDPNQLVAQAKQGNHFGRTGKQRADSHTIWLLCGRATGACGVR